MNKSSIYSHAASPFAITDAKSLAFSTVKSPIRNNFIAMERAGTAKTKMFENDVFFNKNLSK